MLGAGSGFGGFSVSAIKGCLGLRWSAPNGTGGRFDIFPKIDALSGSAIEKIRLFRIFYM
jgi:hypothetical protein